MWQCQMFDLYLTLVAKASGHAIPPTCGDFKSGAVKQIKGYLYCYNVEKERLLRCWISSHGYTNAFSSTVPESLNEYKGE